jgi:ABC-type sugar transport system substrate-binding protein
MAASFRKKGAEVVIQKAVLAGSPCHHLVVDRQDGFRQDMFILHRANTNYSILVTQRSREAGLLDKVRTAFKIVDR